MNLFVNWLVPLICVAVIGMYAFARKQFHLRERTLDEVTQFIQRLDWDELHETFDVVQEAKLIIFSSGYCLRRSWRVRIHTAREFMSRMHHNVRIIQELVRTEIDDLIHEFEDRRPQRQQQLDEAMNLIVGLRAALMIQTFKLTLWILLRADKWPVRRLPSIARLRTCGGDYDLIDNYKNLREAAAAIALRYGQRFHDELHAAF